MKTFKLTFEERSGYLYACVAAPTIDRKSALEYLHSVAEQVKSREVDRLMLERDIPVMLPASDLFFTTQDFLKMIGRTRVAFVNPHTSIEEEMKFAMTIGTNRGANYRLFDNIPDAEAWLLRNKMD